MKKLLLVTILLLLSLNSVTATTCFRYTPSQALEEADAIFTGTVIDIEPKILSLREVRFQVNETWKGPQTATIKVVTEKPDGLNLGYEFEINKKYLIYAHYTTEDKLALEANICGVRTLNEATPEINDLGKSTQPTSDNSQQNPFEQFFSWVKNLFL